MPRKKIAPPQEEFVPPLLPPSAGPGDGPEFVAQDPSKRIVNRLYQVRAVEVRDPELHGRLMMIYLALLAILYVLVLIYLLCCR